MKTMKHSIYAILILALTSLIACSKNNEDHKPNPLTPAKQYTTSRATAYGDDWVYFSFKEGKEVTVDEATHKTNSTWDIAFNRYNIRTNSGKSGDGKGGAYDAGKIDFNSVKIAVASGYTIDTEYTISDVGTGFPPPTKQSTANTILCKAIMFSGPPPTYTLSEHVYVVKCADGKYAKVQFTSFHNKKGESGYITFKYIYQPDGSKNIE